MLSTPLKYFRTVRNLTGRQVMGQLRNRMSPHVANTVSFFNKPTPAYPGCRWPSRLDFPPPGGKGAIQPHATAGKFTFLNRAENLGWPPAWNHAGLPLLWQYNLHYFDWIWALSDRQARAAVDNWIAHHPLGRNQVGWDAYPTSLRLMNWAAGFFGRRRAFTDSDPEFRNCLWRSLLLQTEWLSRQLEYHLLANHLFENAAALAFVGSCFCGAEASRWQEAGLSILREELDEQILPDGMHFERSSMYHIRVLYVLQLLACTRNPTLVELTRNPIKRMRRALLLLCHPDGRIPLLNDSAFGIYSEPHQLLNGSDETRCGPFALPDAGYYGWRGSEGHYLICDAGPLGPDYQPGHSHADIFSFELSLSGQRVIVDSGVSSYEAGPDRDYCRSTRAHNTLEIGGQDQCEMWGSFRVARRARVNAVNWRFSSSGFTLEAVHDGYARLKPGLRHRRRFIWDASGVLQVTDSVEGAQIDEVVSRLHLHPDCHIDNIDGNIIDISRGFLKIGIEWLNHGKLSIENSKYFPEFGKSILNRQISFCPAPGISEFGFKIYPR